MRRLKIMLVILRAIIGCILVVPAIIIGWIGWGLIWLANLWGDQTRRFVYWYWRRG